MSQRYIIRYGIGVIPNADEVLLKIGAYKILYGRPVIGLISGCYLSANGVIGGPPERFRSAINPKRVRVTNARKFLIDGHTATFIACPDREFELVIEPAGGYL